jgi:putative NIF3 family GTP cyclohydrolase 1 type 2
MNTSEIMQLAVHLAGMDAIPADSGIFRPREEVQRILLGIDIEKNDLALAKDKGLDLVLAHHPLNWATFLDVMDRHEKLMVGAGVPKDRARQSSSENKAFWKGFVDRRHGEQVAGELSVLAKELDLGLMNIHLPCDEVGRRILQKHADELEPLATVSALVDRYGSLPEIEAAGEGITLVCGSAEAELGRTVVIHGAGVNGGYPVANALFESGIDTVVYIHLFSEEQKARLQEECKGNLILTGHYGSDSLGINPLVDELEGRGVEVHCCNKMVRVRR